MIPDEVYALVGRTLTDATLTPGEPGALVLTWADAEPTVLLARDARLDVAPLSQSPLEGDPGEQSAAAVGEGPAAVSAALGALVGQKARGLGTSTADDGALTGIDVVMDDNVLSVRAQPRGCTVEVTERTRRRRG